MYGQERKRYAALDIAKGIGILLVVLGHCPQVWLPAKQWIFSFHVPLFFLIAGMVWDRTTHEENGFLNGDFLAKKAIRLLVPCFLWGAAYMLARALVSRAFRPESVAWLLYNSQRSLSVPRAGTLTALWFLSCMFVTVCLFEGIQNLLRKTKQREWILLGLSLVFAALGLFLPRLAIGYPWNVDIAMLGLALMIWGSLLKQIMEKLEEKQGLCLLISLVSLAILTLTYRLNLQGLPDHYVDVSNRQFGNPALFLLDALCGSVFVLSLSVFLSGFSLLQLLMCRVGRDTIPILLIHKPVVLAMGVVFGKMAVSDPAAVAIEFLLAIVISEGIYVLTAPFFPFLYGESRRFGIESGRSMSRYR